MPGSELAIDHGDAVAAAHRHQVRERHFGRIARAAEHGLAEENAPEPHPIETADELAAEPRLDAVRISGVIQVPRLCGRGAAQLSMTAVKSSSVATLKPPLRRVFARLRLTRNSSGKRTARGSGDHQSTGWPGEYQGKMPRR